MLSMAQLMDPACKSHTFSAMIQALCRQSYALEGQDPLTASNWPALEQITARTL
jgi:hypothetical protein